MLRLFTLALGVFANPTLEELESKPVVPDDAHDICPTITKQLGCLVAGQICEWTDDGCVRKDFCAAFEKKTPCKILSKHLGCSWKNGTCVRPAPALGQPPNYVKESEPLVPDDAHDVCPTFTKKQVCLVAGEICEWTDDGCVMKDLCAEFEKEIPCKLASKYLGCSWENDTCVKPAPALGQDNWECPTVCEVWFQQKHRDPCPEKVYQICSTCDACQHVKTLDRLKRSIV